jgi:DNA-binding NtrC family response regulator
MVNIFENFSDSRIVAISREDESEWETIREAYDGLLKRFQGNVSQLVEYLEIPRQSLYNKFNKYGIVPEDYRKKD